MRVWYTKRFGLFCLLLMTISVSYAQQLQTGDLIFHHSNSAQSRAVALVTQSQYTHMGIVIIKNDQPYVFEAAKKVIYTPLNKWIKRGVNQHYVVKRLSVPLSDSQKQALIKQTRQFQNKPYDIHFEWSDDKIYCSELVWKLYDNALGIQIGQIQQIKEFDLTHPVVMKKLKEYYGNRLPSPEEKVITPIAMFNSPALHTIKSE